MTQQPMPAVLEGSTVPGAKKAEKVSAEPYMCRICFEETEEVSELVAPCSCIGTQQYVHFKCLRTWQERVLASSGRADGSDDRAVMCSVCRTKYSVPPPHPAWRRRLMSSLRSFGGALCIGLIAFGLTGAALAAPRAHAPAATRHAQPRPAGHGGAAAGQPACRDARARAAIGGAAGRLWAAWDGAHPTWRASGGAGARRAAGGVRGAAQHDVPAERGAAVSAQRRGASGIVLTVPLEPRRLNDYGPGDPERHPALSHFVGGPVGMASPGARALERVLLHNVPALGAAFAVPVNGTGQQVFVSEQASEMARELTSGGWQPRVLRMYHGIASWAEGQLEGEVRGGSWGFCPARLEDLTADPASLWRRLVASPALQWL
eukprot:CAMPEP_0177789504 /NCGR_PEP_ID=MMETSP0491_2-20121128/22793_1 /TAXON_ID=63592 /ORGANISM="Tetraselmis chuii, Strain PLY429" /LENGTH=375 /DNA_ID=CAMNT_0019311389 /DNA_START=721 /DNA_END=1848 /DNA_ORIENTATION=-